MYRLDVDMESSSLLFVSAGGSLSATWESAKSTTALGGGTTGLDRGGDSGIDGIHALLDGATGSSVCVVWWLVGCGVCVSVWVWMLRHRLG